MLSWSGDESVGALRDGFGGAGRLRPTGFGLWAPHRGGVRAADLPDLDITDYAAVSAAVTDFVEWAREADPRSRVVLVNCAAWTDVNGAEAHEPAAFAVNALGPSHLARAACAVGAEMIHISTDYVFDGAGQHDPQGTLRPYRPDDPVGPVNAYGRTKLAGEWAVASLCPRSWIVRTAWVYSRNGHNFVRTIGRLLRDRGTVTVVDDQHGTPTWSYDLARGLLRLAACAPAYRTYHFTGSGETTWYGFARAIAEELGLDPDRVRPSTSDAFPQQAPRPGYSLLSLETWQKAGLGDPVPWRDALRNADLGAWAQAGDGTPQRS